MGASCTGSYEVTSPGRSRASSTTHRVDRSRQGQQTRVSLTEGQTQRAVPGTSSLSYGSMATQSGASPHPFDMGIPLEAGEFGESGLSI
jgi:hypothetical protein